MEKSSILHLETRKKIFDYIKSNPGLHKIKLSNLLNIPYTTLDYHLRHLIKLDIISKKKYKAYYKYYVKNTVGNEEKKIIDLFRQKIPKITIYYLMFHFVGTVNDISKLMNKHPTTVEYHFKKLLDLDIIEPAIVENDEIDNKLPFKGPKITRRPKKNEKMFRIKDRVFIEKVMINIKKSIFKDKDFKIFYSICEDIKSTHGIPNKIKSLDENIDTVIDSCYSLFPNPWCA